MQAFWRYGRPGLNLAELMLLCFTAVTSVAEQSKQQCSVAVDNRTCIHLPTNFTCFGVTLPYNSTSLKFATDSQSLADVEEKLHLWSGLRNVPRCWAVLQPLLCSVYLPRCNGSHLELSSREVCERTREPCNIVTVESGDWPEFLQCHQPIFRRGCVNVVDNLAYNKTSLCEAPLVKTTNPTSWYDGVEGCGIQCQNPLFTSDEHQYVHNFIAVVGSVCMICCLFTILTFIIDWKSANRYPAIILFFINTCFFLGSVGWLAQFVRGARTDIVCRKDGTMRIAEPQINSGESASCTIVFFIVYFFMLSGIMWFVILAFSWHLTFKSLGRIRDNIEGKTAYFHIVAWSLPLVMTIVCLAIAQVDGDSLSGICFVGYMNHGSRAGLVLVPVGFALVCGVFFLLRGLISLIKLRYECPSDISNRVTSRIMSTIVRIGMFTLMALIFVFVTFAVHIYIFMNESVWQNSFREFVICEGKATIIKSTGNQTRPICEIKHRPNLAAVMINIFSYFAAGITMSSWVWNQATLAAWGRFFRKVFQMPVNRPVKLKKHKMIAKAFAKRHQTSRKCSQVSAASFVSTHDDPLGMKLDLNSISSRDVSSNWAQALPRLIVRRGGVLDPVSSQLRRFSDSDLQSLKSFHQSLELARDKIPPDGNAASTMNNFFDATKTPLRKTSKKRSSRNRKNNACGLMHQTTNGELIMDADILTKALQRCSDSSLESLRLSTAEPACDGSSLTNLCLTGPSPSLSRGGNLLVSERKGSLLSTTGVRASDRVHPRGKHRIIHVAEQPELSRKLLPKIYPTNATSQQFTKQLRKHTLPPINKCEAAPANTTTKQCVSHKRTDSSLPDRTRLSSQLPGVMDDRPTYLGQTADRLAKKDRRTPRPLVMNRPNPVPAIDDLEPEDISTSEDLS